MIDAHHHFWHPARGDYGWMPKNDPVLSRPYAPADLAPALAENGVTRTVLVQAAPTLAETEYLLGIADATVHVAGVVGWIDFEDLSAEADLHRLAAHPKFLGVRPMIQDLPDDDWMLREDIQWAFRAITELDLTFDALGFPRHIRCFERLLAMHPDMRVVLDHCLKPQINGDGFEIWAEGISRLAETGASCKLSGLVTEAETDRSAEALLPYVDHILSVFGAERVMWGSDWPVVRLKCEYGAWLETAKALVPEAMHAEVFEGTARRFYRL